MDSVDLNTSTKNKIFQFGWENTTWEYGLYKNK